jgi:hypothetical protein
LLLFPQALKRLFTVKNLQRLFTAAVLLGVVSLLGSYALNFFLLQRPLNRVVMSDARNTGVRVGASYKSRYSFGVIVFDVRGVAPPAGAAGVLRTFLQFAHELQGRHIDEVIIAYRGQQKFKMMGEDFIGLGASVGTTQPKHLLMEMAHNLRYLNNKLVLNNLPGNYASLLRESLHDGSETKAADQLMQTITH